MQIEDTKAAAVVPSVAGGDIPEGQVFTGSFGRHAPSGVYLRVYDGVVDLHNPHNVWGYSYLVVYNYVPREAKVVLL